MKPLRISDDTISGETAEISSDVKLPESRVKDMPDAGSESSSGDITTEFYIDEFDPFIAAALCSDWVTDKTDATKKTLALGTLQKMFAINRKYYQAPVVYRLLKDMQVDQMKIDFALNSKVKLTFSMKGSNNPDEVAADPVTGATYAEASTTKSYTTLRGSVKIGDTAEALVENIQIPNLTLTVNNSLDTTEGLFQNEAIDSALGDLSVTGSMDLWNSDITAIRNSAKSWAEKYIQIILTRTVGTVATTYTILIHANLKTPTDSKDGNKLKMTIPFEMHDAKGITFTKVQVTA